MDVLHEIFRSNGRQQTLIQQHATMVGRERGLYLVRGINRNPHEIVSVYLTDDEVDRLIRERERPRRSVTESSGFGDIMRGLARVAFRDGDR